MLSFVQFCESTMVSGMSIARESMPQVYVPDFLLYLDYQGIKYTLIPDFDVSVLKPTQKDFDDSKVYDIAMSIKKSPESVKKWTPILTTDDGYVLDGHRRFLAAGKVDVPIPVVVIDGGINRALRLAFEFIEYDKNAKHDKNN